jgi:Trypsin-like peptidase domain/VHL beta domain
MPLSRMFVLFFPILSAMTLGISFTTDVLAQVSEEGKVWALQPNVVKVTATLGQDVGPQTGFGFIVGQQQNQLVIVTADHVVRGDDPGAEDKSPLITFFLNQGLQTRGTLQSVGSPKEHSDLAVILVQNPGFATFVTDAIDTTPPEKGLRVWVIGRAGGWNIPRSPGVVMGTDSLSYHIKVDKLAARVGSSGGPLVSSKGILGMVVSDDGLYTEATQISSIQAQVRGNWHYVWQLTTTAVSPSSVAAVLSPGPPVNDIDGDAKGGLFSCNYETSLKSLDGSFSTNLLFRNSSTTDISLFWLNHEGKRTFYYTLQKGAQYSLRTYISHPWVVVDEQGRCLELVLPGKSATMVDVR